MLKINALGRYNGDQSNAFLLGVGLKMTVKALFALLRGVVLVSDVSEIVYDVPRFYEISSQFSMIMSGLYIRPTIVEYNSHQYEV